MIQGHPDIEFDRLAKAVMHMPISNADDVKERFPKELPRRLFPKVENLQARQRCAAAICSSGNITIRTPTFPPPPPTQPPPPSSYSPYPTDVRETAVSSDSDNEPVSIPIERERKPYTAREGTGKRYGDFPPTSKPSTVPPVTGATPGSAPPDAGGPARIHRTYSNASAGTNGIYRTTSHSDYPPSTTQTSSTALVPMSMAPVDAVPHSVPAGMMATALALNRITSVIFQRHTTLATYTAIRAMAMPVRHAHQHGRSSPRPTGRTSTGTAIAAISPAHSRDTTVSMKMTTIGAGSIAPAQHHMVPTPTGVTLRLHRGIHDGISTL